MLNRICKQDPVLRVAKRNQMLLRILRAESAKAPKLFLHDEEVVFAFKIKSILSLERVLHGLVGI